ncbi:MAG: wax ester/triacylglycerol synthase family O-acyltransferase [Pseudomonadota bacterium]
MKHLSGLDAMFLHVESAEMPMHVGSMHVLDLPAGYNGDYYEDVKAALSQRLHLAEVFTRKLALMPFDLSNPVWIEDEDIDLEHHIRHITLSKPGSNQQLQQLVARLHSSLMDRSRPLWELVVIDGLKTGQVALYAKAHHSAIDGQAGVALARALFDLEPQGRQIRPPRAKARRNQYQLGVAELAWAATRNTVHQYVKLGQMVPEIVRTVKQAIQAREPGPRWQLPKLPKLPKLNKLLAPRSPLNVAITNQRAFAARTVPLAEVKRVAQQLNVSLNDVVMACTAGALRRYLSDSGELPARSLSAAVPVSLRAAGDATSNNQVSMVRMHLATDIADPLERLRQISASSSSTKAMTNSVKTVIPTDFPLLAAPWLVSGVASLLGRSRLANVVPPLANVLISNVPGVPVPLYFAGARMLCYYPVSIPAHGMALNVTVQSYDGRLDYGLIGCHRAVPDIGELGDYLLAEHRQIAQLAQAFHDAEQVKASAEAEAKASAKAARPPKAAPVRKRSPAAVAGKAESSSLPARAARAAKASRPAKVALAA